jgi:hypothetical protein
MPIFMQEVSRAYRRFIDKGLWKLYFATHGRIGPPHGGWWNFEFLRNGKALRPLIDDLKSDFWDKSELNRFISNIAQFSHHRPISDIEQVRIEEKLYTLP